MSYTNTNEYRLHRIRMNEMARAVKGKKVRKKKAKKVKNKKPYIRIITRSPGIWRIPDNF